MMVETIKAGVAALQTLESWGVTHIYGIPGGTFNNMMYALHEEKSRIKYIHVRHEEVGALAAVADGKLTGRIGVEQRIFSKALTMPKWIKCLLCS